MVDAWERIAAWCSEHAPETAAAIRASAGEGVFARVHGASAPSPWPEPLWAFYRWCDGTERTPAGYLFPGFRPLPLAEVLGTWRDLMRATFPDTAPDPSLTGDALELAFCQQAVDLIGSSAEFDEVNRAPAGSPTQGFLPVLLPIAEDQSGSLLVCDRRTRPRSERGAIAVFDRDEGYIRSAPWRSLTALATATAAAVRTGDTVAGSRLRPLALGGRLTWSSAELDPLDHPDGATVDLTPGRAWKHVPGTDLQAKAVLVEGRVRLSYRRRSCRDRRPSRESEQPDRPTSVR